jgi:hypothetical protein
MSFRLLPKDVRFFDLFIADGENLQAAATKLRDMLERFDDLDARIAEIQLLEKRDWRTPSSRRSIERTSTT